MVAIPFAPRHLTNPSTCSSRRCRPTVTTSPTAPARKWLDHRTNRNPGAIYEHQDSD